MANDSSLTEYRDYSVAEEVAHAVTHGLAAIGSIVALVVMVALSTLHGTMLHVAAVSIYGASLILLYTSSTLYHSIPIESARKVLHTLDHAAIYLLIAGSYTPFALISLAGPTGWWLFGIIWTLAIAGVIFKLFFTGRFDKLSVVLYLVMGWLLVFFGNDVLEALPKGGIILLAAGGISYSVGVIFYLWRSLRFNHTIWHVFVVAGSLLQFLAVLFYVIPGPGGS